MPDHNRPVALVTGRSNGIGYEFAKQFLSNGYESLIAAEDASVGVTVLMASVPDTVAAAVHRGMSGPGSASR